MFESQEIFIKRTIFVEGVRNMMDFIWVILIIIAFFSGIIGGNYTFVADAVGDGATSAVNLIISTGGIICFWSGIMEIADRAEITDRISGFLRPALNKLFKNIDSETKAFKYITMNISANLMGLGNAATPLGLSAMRELKRLNDTPVASDNMILFVVLNTASIQLLPTTLCAYRSSFESSAPFEILPAVWITSVLSVAVGLMVAKALMPIRGKCL